MPLGIDMTQDPIPHNDSISQVVKDDMEWQRSLKKTGIAILHFLLALLGWALLGAGLWHPIIDNFFPRTLLILVFLLFSAYAMYRLYKVFSYFKALRWGFLIVMGILIMYQIIVPFIGFNMPSLHRALVEHQIIAW